MGAFSDLVGSKNKGVSGGSAALSASDLGGVGDTSIYKGKNKTERESGRKNKTVKHSRKKGGAGSRSVVPDIVTGGGLSADLLPVSVDDIPRLLPVWVGEWCANNNVQDVRKISPLVFRALCAYIGGYIKQSHILKDDRLRVGAGAGRSACNAYDAARVAGLLSCFTSFCDSCDKVPFASSFAAFCGVSLSYVREYGDKLTSIGLDIRKKTHDAEMDAIRQKTSADSIGRLAILNNEYYGGGGSPASGADMVTASLPASGSFGLIECGKID